MHREPPESMREPAGFTDPEDTDDLFSCASLLWDALEEAENDEEWSERASEDFRRGYRSALRFALAVVTGRPVPLRRPPTERPSEPPEVWWDEDHPPYSTRPSEQAENCPACLHPVSWHTADDGCIHAYSDTTRGRGGIGGQAITSCGCTVANDPEAQDA